jgi:hypothetical protein
MISFEDWNIMADLWRLLVTVFTCFVHTSKTLARQAAEAVRQRGGRYREELCLQVGEAIGARGMPPSDMRARAVAHRTSHWVQPRSIAIAVMMAFGTVALCGCGSAQVKTESYGYGSVYSQYGRD